jgi:hypothetical protein
MTLQTAAVRLRDNQVVGKWLRTIRGLFFGACFRKRAKLKAIREAAGYSYPTADIAQMLEEIERGYQE